MATQLQNIQAKITLHRHKDIPREKEYVLDIYGKVYA